MLLRRSYFRQLCPVPEEALREALLNAVIPKDYSSNVPIQISVYSDKILFWNNGELHPGWTVATLTQKHSSQPFNPDIANAFFRAGMIEAWGRGIEHIMAACKTAGVPVPTLRYELSGLWVDFPLAQQAVTKKQTLSKKLPNKVTDPVTDPVARLVRAIGNQSLAPSEIQKLLKLKHPPTFRENYLYPALREKLIRMSLPAKPNSSLQRYSLTEAGKAKLRRRLFRKDGGVGPRPAVQCRISAGSGSLESALVDSNLFLD